MDRPTVASWFVTLYAIVAVGRLTELIPGAANLPLAKIVFACAFIAVMVERERWSTTPLRRLPMARTAGALYVLAVVSVLFSIWKSNSLDVVTDQLLTVFLSFMVAIKALPNWASIKRLLRGLVFAAAILAVTGLAGFVGGRFEVSESYDPNDLAYVLVAILPLSIGFSRVSTGWRRTLWLATAGLLVLATLLTQSRGGLVALLVVAVTMLRWPFPSVAAAPSAKRNLIGRVIIFSVLAAISWSFLPDDAKQRFGSLASISSDYNVDMTNETGRLSLWKRGFIAAVKRPIGHGVGNFQAVDGSLGGRYKAAHNSFLLVFVELGVLGLFLFIRMYVQAWRSLGVPAVARTSLMDESATAYEQRVLSHAMKLLFVGTAVAGFFLSQTYANVLWLSFAAVAALAASRSAEVSVGAARSWVRPSVGRA